MKLDHTTRRGRWLIALGARILNGWLVGVGCTCRYVVVAGEDHLAAVQRAGTPVVLSLWHNRSFLAAYYLLRQIHCRGTQLTVLASHSRDGELVAQLARRWRLHTVRGSSSRGGREAIRALYRAVKDHASSPVVIPDGPRGPRYEFKAGALILSQLAAAPILPLGFAASRFFTLKSWDRLIVPWPFTKIAITIGAPQQVPRDLSSAALETERQRLETLLAHLTTRAETALGVEARE